MAAKEARKGPLCRESFAGEPKKGGDGRKGRPVCQVMNRRLMIDWQGPHCMGCTAAAHPHAGEEKRSNLILEALAM